MRRAVKRYGARHIHGHRTSSLKSECFAVGQLSLFYLLFFPLIFKLELLFAKLQSNWFAQISNAYAVLVNDLALHVIFAVTIIGDVFAPGANISPHCAKRHGVPLEQLIILVVQSEVVCTFANCNPFGKQSCTCIVFAGNGHRP